MKVEVLKRYKDKHTGNLHNVHETLTMSVERFEEINSTSQGIFVKEIKDPTKKTNKKAGD